MTTRPASTLDCLPISLIFMFSLSLFVAYFTSWATSVPLTLLFTSLYFNRGKDVSLVTVGTVDGVPLVISALSRAKSNPVSEWSRTDERCFLLPSSSSSVIAGGGAFLLTTLSSRDKRNRSRVALRDGLVFLFLNEP